MNEAALRERYRDLVELDRSAAGIRFSASLPDGRPVVVYALSHEVTASLSHAQRFFATLERAAAIRHEAIMRPLAWGQAAGTLHVAFESVSADEIVPGSLSAGGIADIGIQLSRALVMVHATGLIHGAITRSRVVQSEGRARLGEFGLFAALVAGGFAARDIAVMLSQPPYVSPEVVSGSVPDEQSDIYSMGAVLYELLTGKPPYGGRTTSYVLASVLSDDAESDVASDVASPIIDALIRAIERAPDDRWPNAAAFAGALEAGVAAGKGSGAASTKGGCLTPAAGAAVMVGVAAVTGLIAVMARG